MDMSNPLDTAYAPLNSLQLLFKNLPWWISTLSMVGYIILLFVGQWALFRLLKKWALKRGINSLFIVLQAFERSIVFFLLSATVGIIPVAFPTPKNWGNVLHVSAKLLTGLAFAVFVQRLLSALYKRYESKNEILKTYSNLIPLLINVGIYSIFLIIFLDAAGISITPLIASLGVGGVAIAFALQETLSSFFAGLYLLTDTPLRLGDFIKLESGEEGFVEAINWRSVRLKTLTHNIIIIPNLKLGKSLITNFSMPTRELVLSVEVSVDYSSNLEVVEKITLEVAREVLKSTPAGVPHFEPLVRFHTLGDSGIHLSVVLQAKQYTDQPLLKHVFIKQLLGRYRQENIVVPFPTQVIHLKKE